MVDILNDDKYIEYRDLFRSRCKQKYAATEIAFIHRGLSGEPLLLLECSKHNVKLIKKLIDIEQGERSTKLATSEKDDIRCVVCGEPIIIMWQAVIREDKLMEALEHKKIVIADRANIGKDVFPSAHCGCSSKHGAKPTVTGEVYRLISGNPLMEDYADSMIEAEDD